MDRLIYTALGAISNADFLRVQQANDMANVATVGYKRSASNSAVAVDLNGSGFNVRSQAVVPSMIDEVNLTPGAAISTGNPLDIFMENSTVMGVQAADGSLAFTRRGDLHINATGVLETGSGDIVMSDGGPITIPTGTIISISRDGTIFALDPQAGNAEQQPVGELMLRDASGTRLLKREDGLYTPKEPADGGDFTSGNVPVSVIPEMLEGSNVNPIEVMVSILDMQRSFETQMKIIKNTEEMDRDGANLMRLS
ncbi:MAG: flagellar basal body rod C-terminal domain-containing protein [Pseudohongiellaceae bacterium]